MRKLKWLYTGNDIPIFGEVWKLYHSRRRVRLAAHTANGDDCLLSIVTLSDIDGKIAEQIEFGDDGYELREEHFEWAEAALLAHEKQRKRKGQIC